MELRFSKLAALLLAIVPATLILFALECVPVIQVVPLLLLGCVTAFVPWVWRHFSHGSRGHRKPL
jgi:hypothetical protein